LFYAIVCLEMRNIWILEPTENTAVIEDRPAIWHAYPHFRKMGDLVFSPVVIIFGKESATEGTRKRRGDRVAFMGDGD